MNATQPSLAGRSLAVPSLNRRAGIRVRPVHGCGVRRPRHGGAAGGARLALGIRGLKCIHIRNAEEGRKGKHYGWIFFAQVPKIGLCPTPLAGGKGLAPWSAMLAPMSAVCPSLLRFPSLTTLPSLSSAGAFGSPELRAAQRCAVPAGAVDRSDG
jgi:hypothetical protein